LTLSNRGYLRWNSDLGGQTPCYSTLQNPLTPPSIVGTGTADGPLGGPPGGSATHKPTSAIVNVVYAMHYPVTPPSSPSLSTNTKIGIGAGSGAAAITIGLLVLLLLWRSSQHKKERAAIQDERDSMYRSSARYSMPSRITNDDAIDNWRTVVPPLPMAAAPPAVYQQNVYRPVMPQQQESYISAAAGPQQHMSELRNSLPPHSINTGNISPVEAPHPAYRQELQDAEWAGRHELHA
jgi:hypothetical protein